MNNVYYKSRVVLAWYSWVNKSGQVETKRRPCIIKECLPSGEFLLVKITTKNKAHNLIPVAFQSKLGIEMGLLEDSFISVNETLVVPTNDLVCPIRLCPPLVFSKL